jgi:hypothetical protein
MSDLKAYSCMETYSGEWSGAIIFAKSNIEARKAAANEFNEGELGGMQVIRAPWADIYAARHLVPISAMVDHGWHFECVWSGCTIDSDLYENGIEFYNKETDEYEWNEVLKGKEPVGFQNGPCFACQEYADKYKEAKIIEKDFNEEQVKIYRDMVVKRLPDAVLIDQDGYMRRQWIGSRDMKTSDFLGFNSRYISEVHIPFSFPGMKHWAALEFRQPEHGNKIGPNKPAFVCASGDREMFENWAKEQKEKYNK